MIVLLYQRGEKDEQTEEADDVRRQGLLDQRAGEHTTDHVLAECQEICGPSIRSGVTLLLKPFLFRLLKRS
jgi:hypothetical protein